MKYIFSFALVLFATMAFAQTKKAKKDSLELKPFELREYSMEMCSCPRYSSVPKEEQNNPYKSFYLEQMRRTYDSIENAKKVEPSRGLVP